MSAETITPDSEHGPCRAAAAAAARLCAAGAVRPADRLVAAVLALRMGRVAGGCGAAMALIAWLLLGSIAMRGAGCVYNDIVDADLDRQVARTASRPMASGRVSRKAAWVWLLALCGVGLVVLLQLRWEAQLVALGQPGAGCRLSLHEADHLVAAGVARAGVHLGRAGRLDGLAGRQPGGSAGALCAARSSGAWATTRSTPCRIARTMRWSASSRPRCGWAGRCKPGVGAFYAAAIGLWAFAFWLLRGDWIALAGADPGGAASWLAGGHARCR